MALPTMNVVLFRATADEENQIQDSSRLGPYVPVMRLPTSNKTIEAKNDDLSGK